MRCQESSWHPSPTIRSRANSARLNPHNSSIAASRTIKWTSVRTAASRPLSGTFCFSQFFDLDFRGDPCYNSKTMRNALEIPPPEERLCVRHGRPIMPNRWQTGNRTVGCARCKSKAGPIPPPEQRLCPKHRRPITPSAWLRLSRKSGCCECLRETPSYKRCKDNSRKRHSFEIVLKENVRRQIRRCQANAM